MQGLAILIAAGCLGQFLHYETKAMTGQMWGGNTEPNPLTAGFWADLVSYFRERPGRTIAAVMTNGFALLAAVNVGMDLHATDPIKIAIAALVIGWASDLMINRAEPK